MYRSYVSKNTVEIGTFCTDPHIQNMKVGRHVLEYAEQFGLQKSQNWTVRSCMF